MALFFYFLTFFSFIWTHFYQVREIKKMHCFAICSDRWMDCINNIGFWTVGLFMHLFKQFQINQGKNRHNVHKVVSDVCMCNCSEMISQHSRTKMSLKSVMLFNVNCIHYYTKSVFILSSHW